MRDDVEAYLQVLAFALAPALLFRALQHPQPEPGQAAARDLAAAGVAGPEAAAVDLVRLRRRRAAGAGIGGLRLGHAGGRTTRCSAAAVWLLRSDPFYTRLPLLAAHRSRPTGAQLRQFARLGVPAGLCGAGRSDLVHADGAVHRPPGHRGLRRPTRSPPTSRRSPTWCRCRSRSRPARASATGSAPATPRFARRACARGFELTAALRLAVRRRDGGAALASCAAVYSANPAVIALGATLLLATALYHFADALQTLCVFVLRCYRRHGDAARAVLRAAVGRGTGRRLPAGLSRHRPWAAMASPLAFWLMGAAALALTAGLFVALLLATLRRRR